MSRFTQPRRMAALHKHMRRGQISEFDITPDEARTALYAILAESGFIYEEMLEHYDPRRDEFRIEGRNPNDQKLYECWVPGENVGRVVRAMRQLAGTGSKRLMRPSEIKQLIEKVDKQGASDFSVSEILRWRTDGM